MPILVMKFGGTSVATPDRIRRAAKRVGREVANGYDVIVIVSAMAGKTNELVGWVEETSPLFDAREYDAVVSSGENVTAGLMALTLQEMDVPARSWQGWQVPLQTTSAHAAARIEEIPTDNITAKFAEGMRVAVVAGFQGISPEGRITTLGRGGSDTTAVAFAAAFGAERCDIYTDVDGVYTTDPRITTRPASSTGSPSRRCWNWPRWARRCCRPARSNWRCATRCACGCCRASRNPSDRRARWSAPRRISWKAMPWPVWPIPATRRR
jgi:aspartate kinase